MKIQKRSTENGQALVLIVLSMIVLLGFTALAVDGGMVYSDRRYAQNAADASSLAGGGAAAGILERSTASYTNWPCNTSRTSNIPATLRDAANAAEAAAIERGVDNDFALDADISDEHGVEIFCGMATAAGKWPEKYVDIQTMVTHDTRTAFAHFVFPGLMRNTVESVTRVHPRTVLGMGYAIVSLADNCDGNNGVTLGGTGSGLSGVYVKGGGIFSNSCLYQDGNITIEVTDVPGDVPPIACTVNTKNPSKSCFGGGSIEVTDGMPQMEPDMWDVPPPDCSSLPDRGSFVADGKKNGHETIQPGRYSGIKLGNKEDDVTMQPGLYCISGDFSMSAGKLSGTGVTIFVRRPKPNQVGNFLQTGGDIVISAPPAGTPCPTAGCPPALQRVLIYLEKGNTGTVKLTGNGDCRYMGLIYAPAGTIEAGGTSGQEAPIHAQLVANSVKIDGTAYVDLTYDSSEQYILPTNLELYK
ncbi:MAG: Tad domain-containing protein [Anaerolineales bacterium]|nr:Tad domain-containing protein [Anaerolineales bacterium]